MQMKELLRVDDGIPIDLDKYACACIGVISLALVSSYLSKQPTNQLANMTHQSELSLAS